MADIKRKKSIFEYIIPWVLIIAVFVILVFVFNQDNTVKNYSENQVIEALSDQDGDPNNSTATTLFFSVIVIFSNSKYVAVLLFGSPS